MGAATEVHKANPPGLLELICEWCLQIEYLLRDHQENGISFAVKPHLGLRSTSTA